MGARHIGRRVTIIGGAGFIGHHLALMLRSEGAEVSVIDHLQVNNLLSFASASPSLENRALYVQMITERLQLLHDESIPIHTQDARDERQLGALLDRLSPHVVIHLAAISNASECDKAPYRAFDHGLRTLAGVLDWAKGRLQQFLFVSSSMVYGDFRTPAIDEEHPLEPKGIYGAVKRAGETMVRAHGQAFKLPYTIIRPSALYGPRCVSRRVVQRFIEAALGQRAAIIEGDLSESLDFTYVDDLVRGISRAIGHTDAIGEAFNLTYGQARSLRDLTDLVRQHFPDLRLIQRERDALRPFRGTLSVDKARRLIGYEPAMPLERGLTRYVEWYRTFFHEQAPEDLGTAALPRPVSAVRGA